MYTTPPASNNSSHTPATHSQHHKSTLPQQNKFCHNSYYGAQGGLVVIINFKLCFIMIQFNDAVASLRKTGAKSEADLIIKNVTITEKDSWIRVALTLNRDVQGPISDDNGDWSMGTTNVVFMSLYSIAGVLKNTDDTIAIAGYIVNHPTALQIILSGAKIEILQQEVKAHDTYINAFTGEEVEHESDHDSIFNHLVSVALSDKGLRAIEKIDDKLLGI